MSATRDDFEEQEFEETEPDLEDYQEADLEEEEEEDLFEEQEEEPPPKPSRKRKQTRPKKADVEAQEAKSPFTKYLLIGIAALCLVGGALWIVLPVLMPGDQAQYSANQTFQTTPSTLPQPQAQQQTGASNDLFVEQTPSPAVQEPSVKPPQPDIQSPDTMAAVDQSMADPVSAPRDDIEDNRFDDIQEMMVEQGKELEKLEKIFAAVQELKNRPSDNESFKKNELLKKENEDLLQKIADLEADNKDLRGKNTYLRHLQNEQAKEIKSLNLKLSKAKSNEGPDQFLSFSNKWQLTGLTSHFAIFRNTKDLSVVRVNKGETIDGVKIVDINSYAGIIKTSAGDIIYNAG